MYFVLLVASFLLFSGVCLVYLRQDFASIFHPVSFYLLFHGLVFVIRPFFAWAGDYNYLYQVYGFTPSPETKAIVIISANLGLLAFVAGAWRTGSVPLLFRQGPAELAHRLRLLKPFLLVAAVLGPLAAASLWTYFSMAEWTMRLDRATGVTINTTANGWFTDAQMMLVPLSVLFAWVYRYRWWSLAPLVAFVALRAGTGSRGAFVVACVAAALLWLYDRRRLWPTSRAVILAVAIGSLFYVVGQERGVVKAVLTGGQTVEVETRHSFIESMDFANLEFFEFLVETIPAKTGTYGYFLNNLQVFTEPIPRKLWEDKPIGAPIKLYNLFDHGFPIGMTNSLPGEGWAQAGYLGVIAWCGLWGLALGAIYRRFARSRQGNFEVALYFAFLPVFVVAFRDGLLLTIVRTAFFYIVPILAWMAAARLLGIPGRSGPVAAPPPRERTWPPQPRGAPDAKAPRRGRLRLAEQPIVPRAWRPRLGAPPAE